MFASYARVAELVDARDLKSLGPQGRASSTLAASSTLYTGRTGTGRQGCVDFEFYFRRIDLRKINDICVESVLNHQRVETGCI